MDSEKPELTLIMKGGGIKGIAYVGALEELTKFYSFNEYAGTSAGAISAVLLAAGYTTEELKKELYKKNFNEFKDAWILKRVFNLLIHGGLYKANTFKNWIQVKLSEKLDTKTEVKFKHLPYKVKVYASRRGKTALVFDSSDKKISVAHAVRCSMSIPFIFTPERDQGLRVFDGGIQNNYPVLKLLEEKPDTKFIGLYLGDENFKGYKDISWIRELFAIWTEGNDEEALEIYSNETIIINPKPISTLDFSLTTEEKEFLLEAGRLSAIKFLRKNNHETIPQEEYDLRKFTHDKLRSKLIKVRKKKKRKKWVLLFICIAIIGFAPFAYKNFIPTPPPPPPWPRTIKEFIDSTGLKVDLLVPTGRTKLTLYDYFINDSLQSKFNPSEFLDAFSVSIVVITPEDSTIRKVNYNDTGFNIIFCINKNYINNYVGVKIKFGDTYYKNHLIKYKEIGFKKQWLKMPINTDPKVPLDEFVWKDKGLPDTINFFIYK